MNEDQQQEETTREEGEEQVEVTGEETVRMSGGGERIIALSHYSPEHDLRDLEMRMDFERGNSPPEQPESPSPQDSSGDEGDTE